MMKLILKISMINLIHAKLQKKHLSMTKAQERGKKAAPIQKILLKIFSTN